MPLLPDAIRLHAMTPEARARERHLQGLWRAFHAAPTGTAVVYHTADCLARTSEMQAARAAWCATWPDHCRACGGAGGFRARGWALDAPDEWDECNLCDGQDRCGRCAASLGDGALHGAECPACGWDGTNDGDFAPPDPAAGGCGCGDEVVF